MCVVLLCYRVLLSVESRRGGDRVPCSSNTWREVRVSWDPQRFKCQRPGLRVHTGDRRQDSSLQLLMATNDALHFSVSTVELETHCSSKRGPCPSCAFSEGTDTSFRLLHQFAFCAYSKRGCCPCQQHHLVGISQISQDVQL